MLLTEEKLKKMIRQSLNEAVDTAMVRNIQTAIGTKPDGDWGPNTDAAWFKWCKENAYNIAMSFYLARDPNFMGPPDTELLKIVSSGNIERIASSDIGKMIGESNKLKMVLKMTQIPPNVQNHPTILDRLKTIYKKAEKYFSSLGPNRKSDIVPKLPDFTDPENKKVLSPVGEKIVEAYPNSKHIAYEIEQVSKNLDMNPYHLANIINFESAGSFSPSQKQLAGGKAIGLIQFMPKTAKSLGTTTSELASMTGPEQMKYVEKYFRKVKDSTGADLQKAEDIAMVVFFPAAVGKGPNYSIFEYYVRRYSKPEYKRIKFSKGFLNKKSHRAGAKKFGFKPGDIVNPTGSIERAAQVAEMVYLIPNGGIKTAGEYVNYKFRRAKLPTANVNPYETLSGALADADI